ncbi:hypothetical protein A8B83_19095 [Rhodobacteraceae bacterium EhC02]|nr:hypothetical protein A8B83_19095 [Rhodobacteraceae bacterium EhC02]
MGWEARHGMIEPDHPKLSMGQQYALLPIPLPSFYHATQGTTDQTSIWKAPILSRKPEVPQISPDALQLNS